VGTETATVGNRYDCGRWPMGCIATQLLRCVIAPSFSDLCASLLMKQILRTRRALPVCDLLFANSSSEKERQQVHCRLWK
jgi:hypothetical protein